MYSAARTRTTRCVSGIFIFPVRSAFMRLPASLSCGVLMPCREFLPAASSARPVSTCLEQHLRGGSLFDPRRWSTLFCRHKALVSEPLDDHARIPDRV